MKSMTNLKTQLIIGAIKRFSKPLSSHFQGPEFKVFQGPVAKRLVHTTWVLNSRLFKVYYSIIPNYIEVGKISEKFD